MGSLRSHSRGGTGAPTGPSRSCSRATTSTTARRPSAGAPRLVLVGEPDQLGVERVISPFDDFGEPFRLDQAQVSTAASASTSPYP